MPLRIVLSRTFRKQIIPGILFLVAACGSLVGSDAAEVTVKIENLAPNGGLYLTPFWVGFHDGGFDLYDQNSPASAGLERVAEDGDISVLTAEFASSASAAAGGIDGVIASPGGFAAAPVFDPGESPTATFDLDPVKNRYFSYASMVIPSNDAFIANGDPLAIELFDANGKFNGPFTFTILGQYVLDAGTEENNEMQAAFINQTGPDMGIATVGGGVTLHSGFIDSFGNPGGTSIILGGTTAALTTIDNVLGDFTQPGAVIAQITIIPEPSSLLLACLASVMLVGWATRRRFRRE